MKDIFANLYNKVVSFFHQTDNNDTNAKDVACNRLKLVLMQDRTNLTPAIMDRMRKELIELLSKYVELDRELLDLNFEHEDNQMALMLSIPVIRAKNEEEIQEILDKEDEEKKAKELEAAAEEESEEDAEESEGTETSETEEENPEEVEVETEDDSEAEDEEAEEESEESEDEETETKKSSKKSKK
ncbi:MAG: cell division topological specificity factor MinE [Candidatus Gastranaerophilales bacterium]|nr:cell division topological specificity factor MinE [Candidatus Gastranaerophilales bacterium]